MCERSLDGFTPVPVCRACLGGAGRGEALFSCSRCGLPFETAAPLHGVDLCGLCRRQPPAFDCSRSLGVYEGDLRQLVHLFKYGHMRPLARPLADRMAPFLEELGPIDLMTPVPLHRLRRWRRGFNQSDLLAQELSRLTGIPWRRDVLRRVRATRPQFGLSHRQRRMNVQGAFAVRRPEAIEGRKILLIDDIMTTGATIEACASVLRAGGVDSVAALTIARAKRRITEWSDTPAGAPRPGAAGQP